MPSSRRGRHSAACVRPALYGARPTRRMPGRFTRCTGRAYGAAITRLTQARPRQPGVKRRIQIAAAMRPVLPSRRNEKNLDGSSTVHQAPPLDGANTGGVKPVARQLRQVGKPLARLPARAAKRAGSGRAGSSPKACSTSAPTSKLARADAGAEPDLHLARFAARGVAQRAAAWPRRRRAPARASRRAPQPPRAPRVQRRAAAGNRRRAPCRRCRARW